MTVTAILAGQLRQRFFLLAGQLRQRFFLLAGQLRQRFFLLAGQLRQRFFLLGSAFEIEALFGRLPPRMRASRPPSPRPAGSMPSARCELERERERSDQMIITTVGEGRCVVVCPVSAPGEMRFYSIMSVCGSARVASVREALGDLRM